jgi:hypothetical protein
MLDFSEFLAAYTSQIIACLTSLGREAHVLLYSLTQ